MRWQSGWAIRARCAVLYYVHPGLLQAYHLGLTVAATPAAVLRGKRRLVTAAALRSDEVEVFQFLQESVADIS